MTRDQRRQLKRERSSKFGRAATPATPLTSTSAPITVPPEGVPIFWCEATGREFYSRGYRCSNGHHQDLPSDEFGIDPKPRACDQCDMLAKGWSASKHTEYRNVATGELYARMRDLPTGAVYEHPVYYGEAHNWVTDKGERIIHRANSQDGRILCVVLPDGHSWTIDSRANNCTLPDDDEHWCWVRHGRPEDGTLHVDKDGLTCSAGAGSIQTGRWHGFLRHGRLVQ